MEIEQIREQIDNVDSQLLKLFVERMRLGEAVAAAGARLKMEADRGRFALRRNERSAD